MLPPNGPPISFERAAVAQAQTAGPTQRWRRRARTPRGELEEQRNVLAQTMALADAAPPPTGRADRFKLVLDMRVVAPRDLFRDIGANHSGVCCVPAPLLYISASGPIADFRTRERGGSVGWVAGLIRGFLPGIAEPWIQAVVQVSCACGDRHPSSTREPAILAANSKGAFAIVRARPGTAMRHARRARRGAEFRQRFKRLKPTGQRHALATTTIVFIALAIAAGSLSENRPWIWKTAALCAIAFALFWVWRTLRPPGPIVLRYRVYFSQRRAGTAHKPTGGRGIPVCGADGAAGMLSRPLRTCGSADSCAPRDVRPGEHGGGILQVHTDEGGAMKTK